MLASAIKLGGRGRDVKRHLMSDVLLYPHVLYICRRKWQAYTP